MPKVLVSNSKGLYQTSGSGIELTDSHIKPAIETCRHAVTVFTYAADTSSDSNDTYYDISTPDVDFRVWHNVDTNGTEPALAGRTAVEVAYAEDATAKVIAAAAEVAIDAAGGAGVSFVCDDTDSDADGNVGQITIYRVDAGAVNQDDDVGTSTGAMTLSTDGAGQNALTLDKRVSIVVLPTPGSGDAVPTNADGAATDLEPFTLADGAYVGQEKVIIRNDAVNTPCDVDVATMHDDDGGAVETDEPLVFIASSTQVMTRIAHLIWTGEGWARLNAATGSGGVTGGIS